MLNKYLIAICYILLTSNGMADVVLDKIEVKDNQDFELPLSRIDRDAIVKKETLSKERIEHKNATSLAKAIDLEPGVQTTLTCATCGSQRVTLNGMRGENTTILIDGIPAFSSVSSFYGMDAIPMAGVGSIEIMRGAGSSLTAPESIGGAVNIVTERTDQKKFSYLVRGGQNKLFNQELVGIYRSVNSGTLIAAQTNQMDFFDEDNNNVAESSSQKLKSAFIKHDHRIGNRFKVSFRTGIQDLELIGGATKHFKNPSAPTSLVEPDDFEDGDVRKKYLGDLNKISDWIRLERLDAGASAIYHLNSTTNLKFSTSWAKQKQKSIYFHGYDYSNEDLFRFYDLKLNHSIGDAHLITLGLDHRNEEMDSSSFTLYEKNNYFKDSFDFDTLGIYLQDEWFITDQDEINLVLRFDSMKVNWKDKRLANNKLDDNVLAPRIHYKRTHNESLSSRLSIGVGYRAPLTLFESQHGTNEHGFELDIDQLERAETFTYTLNYEAQERSAAASATLTRLHNMAYGDEEQEPLLFKNSDASYSIGTFNLLHIEKVTPGWTIEASFDWFIMPENYKRKLPTAATETRARLISDYHLGASEFVTTFNITGPRNLSSYNYDENYNVLTEDPILFTEEVSVQKNQRSPLFMTIDLYYQYMYNKNLRFLGGITNLLDYTQTDAKESPLSWRVHGDHAHLDNRHIWGPTQGRVIFAGLNYQL